MVAGELLQIVWFPLIVRTGDAVIVATTADRGLEQATWPANVNVGLSEYVSKLLVTSAHTVAAAVAELTWVFMEET